MVCVAKGNRSTGIGTKVVTDNRVFRGSGTANNQPTVQVAGNHVVRTF